MRAPTQRAIAKEAVKAVAAGPEHAAPQVNIRKLGEQVFALLQKRLRIERKRAARF